MAATRQLRVLALPFPAQGHIGPVMKLAHRIAECGIRVSFVIPDVLHSRIMRSLGEQKKHDNNGGLGLVELVPIPCGIPPGDDISNEAEDIQKMLQVMQVHFGHLLNKITSSEDDDDKVSCVISDLPWALEFAKKLGIKTAMFWPSVLAGLLLGLHIPQLLKAGVLDQNGTALRNEIIQLSPNSPAISAAELPWAVPGDAIKQEFIFRHILTSSGHASTSNWVLCNSFHELEPLADDYVPNLLSIGPLDLVTSKPNATFWPEDSACISWLDEQAARSVVYVSFGSIACLSQHQFEELALGLELLAQPFLWVMRADLIDGSSLGQQEGLLERLARQGKIVRWAPQNKVLAHPAIACFLTHCGWNSTIEGLSKGVPFLCWPHIGDQPLIKSYICNVWKVGLGLSSEEGGLISRHEIKNKTEELLRNGDIRRNSLNLMELAKKSISKGGSSSKNFETFIEQLWS